MAITIIGIVLLAVPFMLLAFLRDKKRGAVYIIFSLLLFHTILAVLTQSFGIFYYNIVFNITAIADIILLVSILAFKHKASLGGSGVDWMLVFLVIIAFLSLYQVHYNYTGKTNVATDQDPLYHEAQNMAYAYPYFSDEWYAVLLIKNSIDSHSLPIMGFGGAHFLNLEMFFHSLVAEIMLVLGLNPLTQYTLFSIFANLLIIVLSYIFLRLNRVSKLSAGLSSMLILYIASGANLPGIWNFIPIHLGIIFYLIGLCFMAMNNFNMAAVSSLPILFFYAPLFIFYGAGLFVFSAFKFKENIKKHVTVIIYFVAVVLLLLPVIYLVLTVSPFAGLVSYISSKIFYTSFYGSDMNVDFAFYNVIPISAIFLSLWGLRYIYENLKWLLSVLVFSFIFWFIYSFTTSRFFIEYERAVFFASILVCIISGFGLWRLELCAGKFKNKFKYLEVSAVIFFLLFVPFYTSGERWRSFVVRDIKGAPVVFYPKAPANNYLTDGDLKVFEGIENKRFLSIPWKGTVIGVATENYPVVTKEGTISLGSEQYYYLFLGADCQTKKELAKRMKIEYVYMYEFNCSEFRKIGESFEGFVLYEFLK